MKIVIDGTGNFNKGAELMLLSIIREIKENWKEDIDLYVGRGFFSDKRLKEIGIKKFKFPNRLLQLLYMIPFFRINNRFKIDVVLDASGFRFSDYWDTQKTYYRIFLEILYYNYLARSGTKLFFLPQAFGPFKSSRAIFKIKFASRSATLIFARDEESQKYLINNKNVDNSKILLSPDFTNLLIPKSLNKNQGICIIPSSRMLSSLDQHKKSLYKEFLLTAVNYFISANKNVFILNHSNKEDDDICNDLYQKFEKENNVKLVEIADTLELKSFIGSNEFVISSRYHGLINALSQNIPVLCIGWTHKYRFLLKDYLQEDAILEITSVDEMLKKLQSIFNYGALEKRVATISTQNEIQKTKAKKMWVLIKKKIHITDVQ